MTVPPDVPAMLVLLRFDRECYRAALRSLWTARFVLALVVGLVLAVADPLEVAVGIGALVALYGLALDARLRGPVRATRLRLQGAATACAMLEGLELPPRLRGQLRYELRQAALALA